MLKIFFVEQDVNCLKGFYFVRGVVVAAGEKEALRLLRRATKSIRWGDLQDEPLDAELDTKRLSFELLGTAKEGSLPRVMTTEFGEDNDL